MRVTVRSTIVLLVAAVVWPGISCINGSGAAQARVNEIRLNKTSIIAEAGSDPILLSAAVHPLNAANQSISWESSDRRVASVDSSSGMVTPVGGGRAVITARINGTRISAVCDLRVLIDSPDLAVKFSAQGTDKNLVEDIFVRIHEYLDRLDPALVGDGIKLGDYLDLPDLSVMDDEAVPNQGALSTRIANDDLGVNGKLLRLIVVGINSFNPGANNALYQGGVDEPFAHIVMQFQNLPVQRSIKGIYPQAYVGSEMQLYLTSSFIAGLQDAGVPVDDDTIIWGPTRKICNTAQRDLDIITDKLWLPTEWEMFGNGPYSYGAYSKTTVEDVTNQAYLEYYNSDLKRIKYNSKGSAYSYWEASPYSGNSYGFCSVSSNGSAAYTIVGSDDGGLAPAFCVR